MKNWTRRALLKQLAGGAALLPFVPLLGEDAHAQAPARKRLIVFFHPNGYGQASAYFPSGGESDFKLSPILTPLAAHRSDLVVFKGINNPAGPDSGNNVHIPHMGSILTGTAIQRGTDTPFFEGSYQYGWAGGISVDQFIAQKIAATPGAPRFSSLDYHCVGNRDVVKTQCRMSYLGAGKPVVPEIDPRVALKRLVGNVSMPTASNDRRSVLDYVMADLHRLEGRVGSADRARLEGHLDALRELESRLDADSAACKEVALPAFKALQGPDSYRDRGKAFLDIIVQALACDATRVVGMQWSNTGGAGGVTFSWLGHEDDEHLASHTPDQRVIDTKIYYMEQLSYLATQLKKIPEGNGTLFDSTMILVLSEHGLGASHDNKDIPFLLLGAAGGAYETGRYLQCKGAPQNQLLVSVCHAMGIEVASFGSSKYAAGPLPGL